MSFKIKNITSGFILQSLHVVILSGVLIFLMVLSTQRKQEIIKANSMFERASSELDNFRSDIDNLESIEITEEEFSSKVSDALIFKQKKRTQDILDSLNVFLKMDIISKSFKIFEYGDSLRVTLLSYSNTYQKSVLILKEKGNKDQGLVSELKQSINLLYDSLLLAPDHGFKARELNKVSNNYLLSLKSEELQEIVILCQSLTEYFENYPDYDISSMMGLIYNITNQAEYLQVVDKRFKNGHKGQYFLLNKQYQAINTILFLLKDNLNSYTQRFNRKWNIIFIFTASILTLLYLLLIIVVGRIGITNIQNVSNLLHSLNVGELNKIPKLTHEKGQFGATNGSIRSLTNHLVERKNFVEKLLNNNFEEDLQLLGKSDEYTKLLNSLKNKMLATKNEQESREIENNIRRYLNEGLAKFSEIMRVNSNNTGALGDSLIKELVRYLNALQGGLFLTNEEDSDELNLISAFAFDRKKYLTKKIIKGEGLVGTCAIEKKTINLTEIPDEYVVIKSGLGDSPPNNILIVPVMHDDDLVGVFEIASLNIFSIHEIELCDQIANSLASSIIAVRNNHKTAQLLEKSQLQAAEMAEQEEEMRQNMEELNATQEESSRREEEMQGVLDAIGSSFYVIEYNTNGQIQYANEKLIKFLEQTSETIIGKKHIDVFSSESLINRELLNKILETKMTTNISETLSWGSRELIYKYSLSAVKNRNGEVIKVLNLFTIDEKNGKND